MKRTHYVTLALLAVLFSAATLARLAPSEAGGGIASEADAAEKERTRRFWELHREAGRHRIAGDYGRAIRLYEAALRLDERHEDALYYLGNLYLETGRPAEAGQVLERLVRFDPTSSRGHSRLGDVHLCYPEARAIDTARARAFFRRALEINREETGPLLRMAQVALVEGETDEAARWLDAILGSNATSIEALYLRGYVGWSGGRRTAAATFFDEAMRLARGEGEKEQVIGEGDRRQGSSIRPGEQATCPVMQELMRDLVAVQDEASATPAMDASYAVFSRALDGIRKSGLPR